MAHQLFIPFTVTNGVRQRGVLSPYLFAVLVDCNVFWVCVVTGDYATEHEIAFL